MLSLRRGKMSTNLLVQVYLCTLYLNCNLIRGGPAPPENPLHSRSVIDSVLRSVDASAQGLITNALFLGDPDSFNSSLADCVWKRTNERASCPDPSIEIILYTNRTSDAPQKVCGD